jgi:hypothetical protein
MIDQRIRLLTELEALQTQRRDAIEAYNGTGDRACMREAQETSQAIADKLRELEEPDGMTEAIDDLMGAKQ